MATVLPPGAKCVLCEKTENLLRCARCKSTFYCSRDCQKKDWTAHKKTCKPSEASQSQSTFSVAVAPIASSTSSLLSKSVGSVSEKPKVPPKPESHLVRAASSPTGASLPQSASTSAVSSSVDSSSSSAFSSASSSALGSKLNHSNVEKAAEASQARAASVTTMGVSRKDHGGGGGALEEEGEREKERSEEGEEEGKKGEDGGEGSSKAKQSQRRQEGTSSKAASTIINMTVSPSSNAAKSPLSKKFLCQEDVPPALSGFEYRKAKDKVDANLLILLHGLGDTMANYCNLAASLSLPQCCTLCLQAPIPLPFDCGFSWFPMFEADGSLIEPTSTTTARYKGLKKSKDLLIELLHTLTEKYGWSPENIFLMGFSQGAIVCLETALHCTNATAGSRLGGCLLFSDSILDEAMMKGHTTISWPDRSLMTETATPIFVSHGTADKRVPLSVAADKVAALRQAVSETNGTVEFKEYDKGHQMINSSDEVRDVFQFLSKHMVMRNPALEKDSSLYSVDTTA